MSHFVLDPTTMIHANAHHIGRQHANPFQDAWDTFRKIDGPLRTTKTP